MCAQWPSYAVFKKQKQIDPPQGRYLGVAQRVRNSGVSCCRRGQDVAVITAPANVKHALVTRQTGFQFLLLWMQRNNTVLIVC